MLSLSISRYFDVIRQSFCRSLDPGNTRRNPNALHYGKRKTWDSRHIVCFRRLVEQKSTNIKAYICFNFNKCMLETLNAYIKLHLVVALSSILINLSQIVLSPVISEGIKWVAPGAAARLGPNTRNTATKGAAPEPADPGS